MSGHYNVGLVALSLAIAVIASYTALDLAKRVSESFSTPRKAWAWLAAGAVAMGTGIWAMHFVGMLAFQLPIPIAYDWPTTCLSMLIAIVVSAVALFVLRRPEVARRNLISGALLMGIGISTMHYTGMIAMRMSPPIRYDPLLFISSILIAILASLAALWIALQLRGNLSRFPVLARLASAGVMGLAIAGMHYTGMAAARFAPESMCLAAASGGLENTTLAIVIGCIAMAIMSLILILSAVDAHFAVRHARLSLSLQVAKDAGLVNAVQLMNEHTADLGNFLTLDEKGRRLPGYLSRLGDTLAAEKRGLLDEIDALTRSIDHIKDIVVTQQSHAGDASLLEPVDVAALLDDALRMSGDSMAGRPVATVKELVTLPLLLLDRHLML